MDVDRLYHHHGLNIFRIDYGTKATPGFKWGKFRAGRIHPGQLRFAFAGRCNVGVICGETSENLFVIDCDSPAELEFYQTALQEREIGVFQVNTGRGGHLYLKCADGPLKSVTLRNGELRSTGNYVIGAGSLHPNGKTYQEHPDNPPTIPVIHHSDLSDLFVTPDGIPFTPDLDKRKTPLKASTLDYLSNGGSYRETIDRRNNSLFAAVGDIKRKNADPLLIEQAKQNAARSGLPQADIDRTAASAGKNTGSNRPKLWQRGAAFLDTHEWKGQAGKTDQRVFEAFVSLYRQFGGMAGDGSIAASQRRLCELTGYHTDTCRRALQRLTDTGILEFAGYTHSRNYPDAPPQAQGIKRYRFGDMVKNATSSTHSTVGTKMPSYGWKLSQNETPENTTLENGLRIALGDTAYQIYVCTMRSTQPLKVAQIAEQTGIHRRTVERTLNTHMQPDDGLFSLYDLVRLVTDSSPRKYAGMPKTDVQKREIVVKSRKGDWQADKRRQHEEERQMWRGEYLIRFYANREHDRENLEVPDPVPASMPIQHCPNCGQTRFADVGDVCPYCNDMTTFQDVPDPLTLVWVELGGVATREGVS